MSIKKIKRVFPKFALILMITFTSSTTVSAGSYFDESSGKHTDGVVNSFNFGYLKKGDYILGSNPGGVYGKYTHAMIAYNTPTYIGGGYHGHGYMGSIIESTTVNPSVRITSIDKVRTMYDEATQYTLADSTSTERSSIVSKAYDFMQNSNGVYDWNTYISNNGKWYCSKLVYRATKDSAANTYLKIGVTYLFLPNDISSSLFTRKIQSTFDNGKIGLNSSTINSETIAQSGESIELNSNDVLTPYIDALHNGEVELLKNDTIEILKDRYQLQKDLLKKNNLPMDGLKELKNSIKDEIQAYKEQVKLIKNDEKSRMLNEVYYNDVLDYNQLEKEADELLNSL